ncbi:hypothetical protein QQX10_04450 [Demequina sp. SYSU T00039]|uniref:PknH-like extracellular domain-containing protein n=1 Tax=Demequina lignilytica TaxID=3051663 RepID=A0AAW7M8S4_9MICO|nr:MULTISPECIES: hypothetical protein [unclassified Demequina]MDN4477244.1 hypothetical protein [Demequina sp. SYSU T00039-1]MDN4487417.1 hypothetical protein [Demequina sp. SYSU T00039]MDN4491170.1 hypothetical protein [Demequina sp. SYSU T00068]
MSTQLKDMLTSVAEEERARVDAAHRDGDTDAYVRTIRPRRAARRAGVAAVALVGVGVAGAGYLALGPSGTSLDPAVETPTPTPAALVSDPDAVAGEPGWTVADVVISPGVTAMTAAEAVGAAAADSVACGSLESFAALAGGTDASVGAAKNLGAFVGESGAATGVRLRSFESVEDAQTYLGDLESIAGRCVTDLEGEGMQARASRIALTGLPGEAVTATLPAGESVWRLDVHVIGADAVAIVTEPGADVAALDVIAAWVEGAVG